jgi:hypothetical protein
MNTIESLHNRIVLQNDSRSSTVLINQGFEVVGLGFIAGQKLARLCPKCRRYSDPPDSG